MMSLNQMNMLLLHLVLICCILYLPVRGDSSFQCLSKSENHHFPADKTSIGLQVTNRATHQLITRIFDIFLREILNYEDVEIIPIHFPNATSPKNSWRTLDYVRKYKDIENNGMINLEVWLPYAASQRAPNIIDAGDSMTSGRFSWFVPIAQVPDANENYCSLHYKIFQDLNNTYYELYLMEDNITNFIMDGDVEMYRNPKCVHLKCATLIAEFRNDSYFIENELKESYLNVVWLGSKFIQTIEKLAEIYKNDYPDGRKRFIVLHWTPSEAINAAVKFTQITLPRCEEHKYLQETQCRYDLTPIRKFYAKSLDGNSRLMYALWEFYIEDFDLRNFQKELKYLRNKTDNIEQIYNEVACNWLKRNTNKYNKWIEKVEPIKTLAIGGIFPLSFKDRGHFNIKETAKKAVEAINANTTILPDYTLKLYANEENCQSDVVMRAFIQYYNSAEVVGVLGPACSETVESIAGLSKHLKMLTISYSADGGSYVDRNIYPYLFRTIGSKSQYVNAYMQIMHRLGWNRVSTLTEDSQQYTDYMSHMESQLKRNNFTLAFNRKFETNESAEVMNEHLTKLKASQSRIIIAELHNHNVAMALCEAIRLGMTQANGYIWFLPFWLPKNFEKWQLKVNDRCTADQLRNAIEGHLSIRHTPFGEPDEIMQEGITVKSWLSTNWNQSEKLSSYEGFVYDAVWAIAIAAHRFIQNDTNLVLDRFRKSANQFSKLIWETDFKGLSGQVAFGQGELGGSRIIDLDILQWRNMSYLEVGKFKPKVEGIGSQLHISGGYFDFNSDEVFHGQIPEDGRYDCRYSGLARGLNISCDLAAMVFSISICLLVIFLMSFVSFYFWKQRYNRKVRQSAQIMKMFGIDLITPSRNKMNTLDKWEITKENVVINRKLGEGAFGTVYGGEAQLGSGDWTAVAVKTLKSGASTEDRLDFLAEAEAMKKFNHKNIIKLLGVCLQDEPIYTIMEFMLYGDLKTYLLARRNMVTERITDESDISAKRLTMYALDVARGLSYLAEQKYVHRDIACRNCLVNSQRVIKIGDFGMARPTFESDYYCFNRKGVRKLFPVRWMPPETLSVGIFTPASDIWSFGVVLFEVISFGSYPYQGMTNNQVLDYVRNGHTLQIPSGVKPPLEGLLKACWSQDATKRPTALEVIDYISNYPRLLTPTLDCPGTAVQMPEFESDEMELLPPGRQSSPLTQESTLDILPSINSSTNIRQFNFPSDENIKEHTVNTENGTASKPTSTTDSFSPTTPDGYSIMSPLLMNPGVRQV